MENDEEARNSFCKNMGVEQEEASDRDVYEPLLENQFREFVNGQQQLYSEKCGMFRANVNIGLEWSFLPLFTIFFLSLFTFFITFCLVLFAFLAFNDPEIDPKTTQIWVTIHEFQRYFE